MSLSYRTQTSENNNIKGRKRAPVFINLQTEAGLKQFQQAIVEADDDGTSPYDRIEVTWPFAMIEVCFK